MISEKLKEHFNNIKSILLSVNEQVEGNFICDVSANNSVIDRNENKIKNLQYLAKNKKTICEIGVNAGHSLLLMIENNPDAEYLIFDLNEHLYTKHCLKYIKEQYPNTKITEIFGDSKFTIPKYIIENETNAFSFDLIHIDGGHGEAEVKSDFYFSTKLISKNGIMVFDDYNYVGIKNFIDSRVADSSIEKVNDNNIIDTDLHFIYKNII